MLINRHSTPLHVWEALKACGRVGLRELRPRPAPIDIMFLFCDHFEGRALTLTEAEVGRWVTDYPRVALRHADADGRPPQHTWFYLYSDETDNVPLLRALRAASDRGCGDIELHLHHGRGYSGGRAQHNVFADVESGPRLRELLGAALRDFERAGVRAPRPGGGGGPYAVIHGAWALDNSRTMPDSHGWCGVNDEIEILHATGCYADFTFPAWGSMQPAKINSIYYASDDPRRPKSHNTGRDLRVGRPAEDALVIFQGPALGGSDVSGANPPSLDRAARWVRSAVHVPGRPEWIFVKVHTHGCEDQRTLDLLLGDEMHRFFAELERVYNDGRAHRLHYVTAREAYNIARAAEAGMRGDPNRFRDFVIPPYRPAPRAAAEAVDGRARHVPA